MEQAIGQGRGGLPRVDQLRQALHRRRQRRKRLGRSRLRCRNRLQRTWNARRHLAVEGHEFERRPAEMKSERGRERETERQGDNALSPPLYLSLSPSLSPSVSPSLY